MAIGSVDKNKRVVMSEINVTPFVDVMLVLLIIFMVTTPILYQGVNVNLPKTTSKIVPSLQESKKLMITLTKSEEVYIENKKYKILDLRTIIQKHISNSSKTPENEQVFIRADSSVRYGYVLKVMNEVKNAGIQKVGLITEPLEKNR